MAGDMSRPGAVRGSILEAAKFVDQQVQAFRGYNLRVYDSSYGYGHGAGFTAVTDTDIALCASNMHLWSISQSATEWSRR